MVDVVHLQIASSAATVCERCGKSQTQALCAALQERVEKAGGQVLYWNGHRVMGVLAMSRAIGDHCLRPYVIPEPEVGVLLLVRLPLSRMKLSYLCRQTCVHVLRFGAFGAFWGWVMAWLVLFAAACCLSYSAKPHRQC